MQHIPLITPRTLSHPSKFPFSKAFAKNNFAPPRRNFTMTTPLSKEPRRFAPLRNGCEKVEGLPKLKGIVFDVDGTLW
jgi:hypothetical protein